jgi:hypothetical protein
VINHCDRHITLLSDTDTVLSHFLVILILYYQRHSMINHCDRHITLLSDTDISFGLFNLFTYFDKPFG